MTTRVGILTGGGDAPGLNAVIRAFVKFGTREHGWEVVGVEDAFNGLMESPRRLQILTPKSCRGLLHRGGTVLGTTNRGDPFAWQERDGSVSDRSEELARAVREEQLSGLVCIGGDGSQRIALRLMREVGIPVIGVPKTIDNDLSATDCTFGFQSAVDIATDALDRLHTTAESHERVLFLEVMGRDTGHIALSAGIAGGADIILLPEIPWDPQRLVDKIRRRRSSGAPFSVVVVAEGALPIGSEYLSPAERKASLKAGRGAGAIAMALLEGRIDHEMRLCVLGHLQRGGSPVPFDRLLATRFGACAVQLVAQGRWGEMVALQNGSVDGVPLEDAAITRFVDLQSNLMRTALAVDVEFGAVVR